MSFITNNLKKVGIVNTILIAICLFLDGYAIGQYPGLLSSPMYMIDNCLKVISIICGLIYAVSGYRKNAAKYYKGFMFLQLLTRIFDLSNDTYFTLISDAYNRSYFTTTFKFIIVVCIAILAFAKDFGRKKSLIVAYISLICDVVIFVRIMATYSNSMGDVALAFAYLVLGAVTTIFVEAKYIDKASRGVQ